MRLKTLYLSGLIILSLGIEIFAQTISPKAPVLLNMDYSRFRYDDQSNYLEIYYGFHPQQLTYVLNEGIYEGGILLSTKIQKSGTDEYVIDEDSPLELSEADTAGAWYHGPFISQSGYAIPYGEYTLQVIASDMKDDTRSDSLTLDLVVTPYGSDIAMSDIELCQKITRSDKQNDLYYKNALEVVPYPSLVYGASTTPVLFHYAEFYNVSPGHNYTVKTELLDANGTPVREQARQRNFASASSIEIGTTPVTNYPSGRYRFQLTLLDEAQEEMMKIDKEFYIFNPHLQVTPRASTGLDKTVFATLSDEDLNEEFDFARHVATEQEKKVFKELVTTEAKVEFMFELWNKVALGRGDIHPIMRDGYLERVQIADERFSAFRKRGWQSDMGKTFILYSEPDDIERIPAEPDVKPYEIWKYYSIENGVEFVFVDKLGFGEMELVNSTKRGELMDENWRRWLR